MDMDDVIPVRIGLVLATLVVVSRAVVASPVVCGSDPSLVCALRGIEQGRFGEVRKLRDPRFRGYLTEIMVSGDRLHINRSGRAQIALADMGDREAINELKEEALQDQNGRVRMWAFNKIHKLRLKVRMATYGQLLQTRSPPPDMEGSWMFFESPEERAVNGIWRTLIDSGVPRGQIPGWGAENVGAWRKWWKENGHEYEAGLYLQPLSASEELRWAGILQNVARSAREWSRILEIGRSGESLLLDYLRDRRRRLVAQVQDDSTWHPLTIERVRSERTEIDAYLEMAIAKLGGVGELEAIAAELTSKDRSVWLGAIEKLGYVGGERALEILEEFVGKVSRNEPSRGVGEALVAARRTIEKLREEEIDTSTSTPQPEPTGDLSWVQDERLRFTIGEAES